MAPSLLQCLWLQRMYRFTTPTVLYLWGLPLRSTHQWLYLLAQDRPGHPSVVSRCWFFFSGVHDLGMSSILEPLAWVQILACDVTTQNFTNASLDSYGDFNGIPNKPLNLNERFWNNWTAPDPEAPSGFLSLVSVCLCLFQ